MERLILKNKSKKRLRFADLDLNSPPPPSPQQEEGDSTVSDASSSRLVKNTTCLKDETGSSKELCSPWIRRHFQPAKKPSCRATPSGTKRTSFYLKQWHHFQDIRSDQWSKSDYVENQADADLALVDELEPHDDRPH